MDVHNQYTATYPAITDVLSREMDRLVLLFGSSSDMTLQALAFRIGRVQRRTERISGLPSLAAQGNSGDSLDFGYFGENGHSADASNPGDDELRIDAATDSTLMEYGVAVQPDDILVGLRMGSDDEVTGYRESSERPRGYDDDLLTDFGAVRSDYTQTRDAGGLPTTAVAETEDQGLFRVDSDSAGQNRIEFAFQNLAGASQQLSVEVVGKTYEIAPITDQNLTRRLVNGEVSQRRVVTYGGFGNDNPNIPRLWNKNKVSVNLGSIAAAGI